MHFELLPSNLHAKAVAYAVKAAGVVTRPFDHRGLWHATKLITKGLPSTQNCAVPIGSQSSFCFKMGDPYWARVLSSSFVYERPIDGLLKRAAHLGFSFYDLGSNFGYWSIMCSDPEIGSPLVVAVEASPSTFERLEANNALNGSRFIALHRAIYSSSEQIVYINDQLDRHAARHVEETAQEGREVETITIDDLMAQYPPVGPALIKVDVEGVEVPAFEGGRKALANPETLVIYEDHYRDQDARPTAWLLENTDRAIFHLDRTGQVRQVRSPNEARRLKSEMAKQHDFFAVAPGSALSKLFDN